MSTRPLSKTKRWRIVRIIKAAPRAEAVAVLEGASARRS
jgi:hypothetical protein